MLSKARTESDEGMIEEGTDVFFWQATAAIFKKFKQ
jgi:hypothetical protein